MIFMPPYRISQTLVSLLLVACTSTPEQLDPFGRQYFPSTQISQKELKDCKPSEYDTPPIVIRAIKPAFPAGERYAGKGAVVTITFVVNSDGSTVTPKSEGGEAKWFINHSLIAVADWKFHPATKDGQAISVSCKYTFGF